MANTTTEWATPETLTTALSTELNSLADGSFCTASSAIDNSVATRYPYIMLELVLASLSPASGAYVDGRNAYAADGTNSADHAKILQTSGWLATSHLDTTATTAQRIPPLIKSILPMKFKLAVRNKAGVALASSGNTLKYARQTEDSF